MLALPVCYILRAAKRRLRLSLLARLSGYSGVVEAMARLPLM